MAQLSSSSSMFSSHNQQAAVAIFSALVAPIPVSKEPPPPSPEHAYYGLMGFQSMTSRGILLLFWMIILEIVSFFSFKVSLNLLFIWMRGGWIYYICCSLFISWDIFIMSVILTRNGTMLWSETISMAQSSSSSRGYSSHKPTGGRCSFLRSNDVHSS